MSWTAPRDSLNETALCVSLSVRSPHFPMQPRVFRLSHLLKVARHIVQRVTIDVVNDLALLHRVSGIRLIPDKVRPMNIPAPVHCRPRPVSGVEPHHSILLPSCAPRVMSPFEHGVVGSSPSLALPYLRRHIPSLVTACNRAELRRPLNCVNSGELDIADRAVGRGLHSPHYNMERD